MQASRALLLLAATCAAVSTTAFAQNRANHAAHLRYDLHGDASTDNFGSSVAFAGDVDKDGCADIVI
ncbi:MAG: integrin alpha, partial [Gammaproteobacteria bacterium]|nr:integrin alpha [Gammaproteobacteria bacterium]